KADSSAPEVAGIVAEGAEAIGGVELRFRHVLNTEAPEIEPASPTDLPGLVGYLEVVKPLLAANIGKPDQAKAIPDETAKAFPAYQLPPLLTLGLSRALQS